MQEELQTIMKRLQQRYPQSDLNQQHSNQKFDAQFNLQGDFPFQRNIKIIEKIKFMQQTAQSLFEYAIRTNRLYELAISQGITNLNHHKQEKQQMEHLLKQEALQAKKTISELAQQIEHMKRQIASRQQNQRNLLEKYQEFIYSQRQVCQRYEKDISCMQRHFIEQVQQMKNIMQFKQHTLLNSIKQNQQIKLQNLNMQTQNEALKTQNDSLRQIHAYLVESEKRLIEQNKHFQKQIFSLQEKIDDLTLAKLQSKYDDVQSILSQQKFTLEVNRSNGSRYIVNFNEEKSLLNISQNYIQSLQSFRAKFNQSEQHIEEGIFRRSRFIKNTIFQILQKQEEAADKSIKKQEASVQSQPKMIQTQNPYESFFSLLVQSQKLNSPHFNKIAHINLKHLFHDFIKRTIPFNKWQVEIRKELQSKKHYRKGHK